MVKTAGSPERGTDKRKGDASGYLMDACITGGTSRLLSENDLQGLKPLFEFATATCHLRGSDDSAIGMGFNASLRQH